VNNFSGKKKKGFWKPHIKSNPRNNTCQMHPCLLDQCQQDGEPG
jgi:hypothetical protein